MPTPNTRICAIKEYLYTHDLHAVIIPSHDPHASEYLPARFAARAWFSGFTGSMGTLVVGRDFCGLWADSRYWVQAAAELVGSGVDLYHLEDGDFDQTLAKLPQGARVGYISQMTSKAAFDKLSALDIELVAVDILDALWQNRPDLPSAPIYAHKDEFVDAPTLQKLADIRQKMHELLADAHLISSLDDIAWTLNLRGSDVEYNPVFLAFLLIKKDSATLFVDAQKISPSIHDTLTQHGISIADYNTVQDALAHVKGTLLIDPNKTATATLAKTSARLIEHINPSTLLKSQKPKNAIAHIMDAMRADGAALCEFFAELEARLNDGTPTSELDIDAMLTDARQKQPHYISPSFATIAGFNGNGAMAHYRATKSAHAIIKGDGLLLIDSGAQYQNGTTDITRMFGVGMVSDAQKRDVTHVLKAHINLARAVFPKDFSSVMIDVLARAPLWAAGLDYGHGTGHGVGYFLNVHEGPQVIAHSARQSEHTRLKLGMIVSNEPAVYRENQWGVRIENLVAVVAADTSEFGEFYRFFDLTLCPIKTDIIDKTLLNLDEINWLNAYHARVRDELLPLVEGKAKQWLMDNTQPLIQP